jgi:hypothetical protein
VVIVILIHRVTLLLCLVCYTLCVTVLSQERVDAIDEFEGQPPQCMADFIIELHLRWHGLRQEAELALYILLVATKHHYKKSTAVHTFARLMDLLNEVSVRITALASEVINQRHTATASHADFTLCIATLTDCEQRQHACRQR